MSAIRIKRLDREPLSTLKALALSLARDIDRGNEELRDQLEYVMALIPDAPERSFVQ